MQNPYLPIMLNITDKPILIIGGGKVAFQKIKILKKFTQNITVIAPEILPKIQKLKLKIVKDIFRKKYLKSAYLIYVCTNDKKLNSRIKHFANAEKLMVNAVDTPRECDFISPAVFIKKEMIVSISSNGKNVKKTIEWRNKIKNFFEND